MLVQTTGRLARMIRVFLVDDHEVVRRGVAELLDREPDIEVVGEAHSAAGARRRIPVVAPDVVLLDVRLPDGTGIDVCRDVVATNPDIRCIMLTGYDDDDALYSAILAGACGYVLKDIRSTGLIDAVRRAAKGHSLIDPVLRRRAAEKLRDGGSRGGDPRFASLTPREQQVLEHVADGLSNKQISLRMDLSEKTIKNYVSAILAKLDLQSRTQAALLQRQVAR